MPSQWQVSTSSLGDPGRVPIATYRAVVSATVESSTFSFNDAIADSVARAALEATPEWAASSWPNTQASSPSDKEYLARLKMKLLMDFGCRLDTSATSSATEAALTAKFGDAAQSAGGSAKYEVTVIVQADGLASWGVKQVAAGSAPRGATGSFDDAESDLQLLVQNLVRADLQRSLETGA